MLIQDIKKNCCDIFIGVFEMTIDTQDLINSIMETFTRSTFIKSDEVPNIDLYMDQVTTFLDERLKSSTRDKMSDEKLMTKTMINNYAKNELIPPPEKKKYSKDHMLLLIFIFYYKSFLQINDIKELLDPIIEGFYKSEEDFGIENIYDAIFGEMDDRVKEILNDVDKKYEMSVDTFADVPEEERDYLQKFYFICNLGTDIFVKKLLIEKMIDSLKEHREESDEIKKNKGEV